MAAPYRALRSHSLDTPHLAELLWMISPTHWHLPDIT